MKILVGFDGSNSAKAALDLAIFHAKSFNAKIEIVHSMVRRTEEDALDIQEAKIDLEKQKQKVMDAGIECETHLLSRDLTPGEDLVEFARENQVDEIVIGVKRRSRLEKLFFGSNAQYIILKAHCPVVTLK